MQTKTYFLNTLRAIGVLTLANMFVSNTAMADEPFIGEIRQFGFTFCPRNWTETNGQLLPIAQNTALFSILGTTFGGDGQNTFAVPNMRGRTVKGSGFGPGLPFLRDGDMGGAESFSLSTAQLPQHSHTASTTSQLNVSLADGDNPAPDGGLLSDDGRDRIYNLTETADVQLDAKTAVSQTTVDAAGSSLPINRLQPVISMRYCIALQGIYPSRS